MAFRKRSLVKCILIATVCVIVLVSLRINSQTISPNDINLTENVEYYPYINPTPGEIPLVASSPWVDGKMSTINQLATLKDCGFNCVLSFTTVSHFKKVEPLLQKLGLKIIAGFPEFSTDSWRTVVDSLKSSPVIGGWRVADEPKEKDFLDVYKLYKGILKADSTHIPYINMIGWGNASIYGKCPDYYAFLMEFQQTFHPSLLSYDLYPISIKDGKINVDYARFYEVFEMYAKISAMIDRPFWAYCQTMAFSNSFVERPVANLAYLSFEAFSALGYGAKGLVYWTYCLRKSNEKENYMSALVDLDYKKSDAWYATQQVNQEIKVLSDMFLNTSHEKTWHTGKTLYPVCQRFVPGSECLANLKGGDKGFQISKLTSGDTNYLVIVNKDIENNQKLSLRFNTKYKVESYMPEKNSSEYTIGEKKLKGNYQTTLSPGRYLILRYHK